MTKMASTKKVFLLLANLRVIVSLGMFVGFREVPNQASKVAYSLFGTGALLDESALTILRLICVGMTLIYGWLVVDSKVIAFMKFVIHPELAAEKKS